MKIDPTSPLFTERGIDEEVALARGYVQWTPEDFADVIATAYSTLAERQPGTIQWLQDKACESDTGIVITRYRPDGIELKRPDGEPLVIVPEIRPDRSVETSMPVRHYHGEVITTPIPNFWGVPQKEWKGHVAISHLPTFVLSAHLRPEGDKRYRLKFMHSHSEDTMSDEEYAEHKRVWHGSEQPRSKVHWHTLKIHDQARMSDHIANSGGKMTGQHAGENSNEVHKHIKLAKYLFASSEKEERLWNDKPHDHSRMSEDELAWHIGTYHT